MDIIGPAQSNQTQRVTREQTNNYIAPAPPVELINSTTFTINFLKILKLGFHLIKHFTALFFNTNKAG